MTNEFRDCPSVMDYRFTFTKGRIYRQSPTDLLVCKTSDGSGSETGFEFCAGSLPDGHPPGNLIGA